MPTHSETTAFLRDQRGLTSRQADRFRLRLQEFIDDLGQMEAGGRSWFRPGVARQEAVRCRRRLRDVMGS